METTKKSLLIFLAILVVGGSAYGGFYILKKYIKKAPQSSSLLSNQTSSEQTVVLTEKYPPGITEEWILESNVVMISKSQNLSGGELQGTLIYESKLSQKVAAEGYEKFLKNRGWITLLTENKKIGLFTINASKGTAQAFITVDQNDLSKKVTVDVTVVGN